MGHDVVKTVRVNGARVQTGRDVVQWNDVVAWAGFPPSARVRVLTREGDAAVAAAREVRPGEAVLVTTGRIFEVRADGH